MDKACQNNLYAGLLIYRLQRNVEYLLLNDTFTNKKHWFCPKGQVIGQEDEIKCAFRETFEATGLSPKDLRIEEGFKIELKYLSGTRPKKVIYRLAQVLDNHARVLPNAEGVHFQWCTQSTAAEKVIFKSMQDVFKYAQSFIDNKKTKRTKDTRRRPQHPAAESNNHHQHHPNHDAPAQRKKDENPLYKTRLCERFETEGNCPYGPKCTFAHGVAELRERKPDIPEEKPAAIPSPSPVPSTAGHINHTFATGPVTMSAAQGGAPLESNNPLFKTRLCERFMKDQFCQYGPKCHFAHGTHELKERPVFTSAANNQHHQKENGSHHNHVQSHLQQNGQHNGHHHGNGMNGKRHEEPIASQPFTAASGAGTLASPAAPMPRRAFPEKNWRRSDENIRSLEVDLIARSPQQTNGTKSTPTRRHNHYNNHHHGNHSQHHYANQHHQQESLPFKEALNDSSNGNKSWMKVVHLSKEEQAKLDVIPSNHASPKSPGKAAQEEAIIQDLKHFFNQQKQEQETKSDVKEVTKLEMRNDLSKRQLLYILLASLLEDHQASTGPLLKAKIPLFQTFVKTMTDQRTLLKAWEKVVTRCPNLLVKTMVAFATWYECDLVDEEAFVSWYSLLEPGTNLERKSSKFIEWLKTADAEEDNEE